MDKIVTKDGLHQVVEAVKKYVDQTPGSSVFDMKKQGGEYIFTRDDKEVSLMDIAEAAVKYGTCIIRKDPSGYARASFTREIYVFSSQHTGLLTFVNIDAQRNSIQYLFISAHTNEVTESELKPLDESHEVVEIVENASGTIDANGHEYVDLGLPSGLLWAKCNVGASTEADLGLYFQWGDTEGYVKNSGYNFSEANYRAKGLNYISTDLDLAHDAAHANMGGKWRMPTKAEFQELYDNTDVTWTYTDVGDYCKFTNKTDASKYIFMPAAGFYYGSSLSDSNQFGYYWSSECFDGSFAYHSILNQYVQRTDYTDRYLGNSVRGVISSKKQILPSKIAYDNTISGLQSTNVQDAIDELSAGGGNRYVVNITLNEESDSSEDYYFVTTAYFDKTYDEIKSALEKGIDVIATCNFGEQLVTFNTQMVDDFQIVFTSSIPQMLCHASITNHNVGEVVVYYLTPLQELVKHIEECELKSRKTSDLSEVYTQDGDETYPATKLINELVGILASDGTNYVGQDASGHYVRKNSAYEIVRLFGIPRRPYLTNNKSLVEAYSLSWDITSMPALTSLFQGCSNLRYVDISKWNTSNVTSLDGMFYGCESLERLDFRGLDTSKVTSIRTLFYGCTSLRWLDLRNSDYSSLTDTLSAFYNCGSLETLIGGASSLDETAMAGLAVSTSIASCYNLKRPSLRAVINGLADLTDTASQTLTLGATLRAILEPEDIAIATGKNWVIA